MVVNASEKQNFLREFKTTEAELRNFRLPGYAVPEMLKSLSDLLDQYFKDILNAHKQIKPDPDILKHDNSTTGDGRHISPGIVSITAVLAVNIVCDVIDGSYSASDNSTTA